MNRGGMIAKIRNIRGIGRFANFNPEPPIELGKTTVIYGENGKGKSSLAVLLRSLKDGGELRLGDRTTLGEEKQCAVIELHDETILGYASPGRGWKRNDLEMLVFDEIFIAENVYEGTTVSKEQKRSLPTLILGKDEIDLVKEEQRVKRSIDVRNAKLQNLRKQITQRIAQPDDSFGVPPDVDRFIAQQRVPNIEELFNDNEKLIGQLKSANRFINGAMFTEVVLPQLAIEKLALLLTSTIEDIESSAFQRVQIHIQCFENTQLESWIEKGTKLTSIDNICPFCGQPLDGSDMVKLYQDYFSEAYRRLLSEVQSFPENHFAFDPIMDAVNSTVAANQGLADFWTPVIDHLEAPAIDFDPIRLTLTNLKQEVTRLLQKKANKPLDAIQVSQLLKDYVKEWDSICKCVCDYNTQHNSNNLAIANHKDALDSGDLEELQRRHIKLNNLRLRYSSELNELCEEYSAEKAVRDIEDSQKDTLQAEIKAVNESIDDTFVNVLNEYLERLHADFRISNVKVRPDGTEWQVDYCIALMNKDIPVGGNQKLDSGQSYKSVLSEGDRRTLALALFLATIRRNTKLEDAIIVFDDPVTSMDDNRSSAPLT